MVGSPAPQRVIETRLIRNLVNSGAVVICAGGGGVPVIRNEKGQLQGAEAVIDKDLTAAVLAEDLEADALIILTDVDGVYEGYGTAQARMVKRATPMRLREMGLPAGSMGPKVEAACRFVELTGDMAAIGRLEDALDIIAGHSGTIVTPGGNYGGPWGFASPGYGPYLVLTIRKIVVACKAVYARWQATTFGRAYARFKAERGAILAAGIAYTGLVSLFAALTLVVSSLLQLSDMFPAWRAAMVKTLSHALPGVISDALARGWCVWINWS